MSIEKTSPTGIEPLDNALGGGLYRGSLTLVEGPTGSGKTLLSSKFLYFGAFNLSEKSIYASMSLSKKFFYSYLSSFSMDFEKLEKRNLFKFLEFPTVVHKEALKEMMNSMMMEFIEFEPKRLAIDPINPLLSLLDPIEIRATIHNTLKKYLEKYEVTGLIVVDTPEERLDPMFREIEFLSDMVLLMHKKYKEEETKFEVNVLKYRGKNIMRHKVELTLEDFYLHKI